VTAKAVATIDHLSGGRFELGIGFGWNVDEIEHRGVEPTGLPELDRLAGAVVAI
jgi:alkanesulfonate monooxygenase SsuD/methylene tetrahydromethanopterin reductase-like flavin-dependent oxidoreductase (luciferase family)